jgi:hypothetical protein
LMNPENLINMTTEKQIETRQHRTQPSNGPEARNETTISLAANSGAQISGIRPLFA